MFVYHRLCAHTFALIFILFFISRVRELTTMKIGTLLRISGQVVRTHPVHPELVRGTFMCLDCQTVIKAVEQQFKYSQVWTFLIP